MKLRNVNYWAIIEDKDGTIVALAHGDNGLSFFFEEGGKLRWLHPAYHDCVCGAVRKLPKHEKYSGYQEPAPVEPPKPALPEWAKPGALVCCMGKGKHGCGKGKYGRFIRFDSAEGCAIISPRLTGDLGAHGNYYGIDQLTPWTPQPDERVRLIEGARDVENKPIRAQDIVRTERSSVSYEGAYLVNTYKDGVHSCSIVNLDQLMPYVEAA